MDNIRAYNMEICQSVPYKKWMRYCPWILIFIGNKFAVWDKDGNPI